MTLLDTLRRAPWVAAVLVVLPTALFTILSLGAARTNDAIVLFREWRLADARAERAEQAPRRLALVRRQIISLDPADDTGRQPTLTDALAMMDVGSDSLSLRRIEPGTPTDSSAISVLPLTITVGGSYPALGRFLDAIETGRPRVRVRVLDVRAPSPARADVEAVLDVELLGVASPEIQ